MPTCLLIAEDMTDREALLFRELEILKGMDDESINTLYSEGALIQLRSGEMLFGQGSESNALYILLVGRLVAVGTDTKTSSEQVYGFIQPGEFVGEMGLISKKPRSLAILAQLESTLFKLNDKKFYELMSKHPQVVTPILMSVIDRLQRTLSRSRGGSQPQSTMLVAANRNINLNTIAPQINDILRNYNINYILLSEEDMYEQCGRQPDWSDVLQWLNRIEEKYDIAIYICADYRSEWIQHCLQYAERVVIVADGDASAEYDSHLTDMFEHSQHQHFVKELVLLYNKPSSIPKSVNGWFEHQQYFRHHHIVIDDK
ncbi:uncharacterized protein METZ01_LOCUS257575, partial [marine metagenome]